MFVLPLSCAAPCAEPSAPVTVSVAVDAPAPQLFATHDPGASIENIVVAVTSPRSLPKWSNPSAA
jgi:hypothetical protein